jgi:hypothetical protein
MMRGRGKAFQAPNSVEISTKLLQDSLFLEGGIGSLRAAEHRGREGGWVKRLEAVRLGEVRKLDFLGKGLWS